MQPLATFQEAFDRLLQLAPSPLFPRARRLYLNKYPLEDQPELAAAASGTFRTFLLEEQVEEATEGVQRIRAIRFALVHWQAPQIAPGDYIHYLERRWQLAPLDLRLAEAPWFRSGGAYASFQAKAMRVRQLSSSEASLAGWIADQPPRS